MVCRYVYVYMFVYVYRVYRYLYIYVYIGVRLGLCFLWRSCSGVSGGCFYL